MDKKDKIGKAKEISKMLKPVVDELNSINPKNTDSENSKFEDILQDAHRRLNRGLKKLITIEEEIDTILWLAYDDINFGLGVLGKIDELEKDKFYVTSDKRKTISDLERKDWSNEQHRTEFRKKHLKRFRELNPTAKWRE